YPAERFGRGDPAITVLEATDDGSRGHRGYVTDLLDGVLTADAGLFACGPNRMLATLAGSVTDGRSAQASLEAPMGCGFGTCLGCALPLRGEGGAPLWGLCCSDGPVMALRAVDWEALVRMPSADVASTTRRPTCPSTWVAAWCCPTRWDWPLARPDTDASWNGP